MGLKVHIVQGAEWMQERAQIAGDHGHMWSNSLSCRKHVESAENNMAQEVEGSRAGLALLVALLQSVGRPHGIVGAEDAV